MAECALESCNSVETERIYLKDHKDTMGRSMQLIIDICESCRDNLAGKNISYNYYRCGNLAFVNEVTECENQKGVLENER